MLRYAAHPTDPADARARSGGSIPRSHQISRNGGVPRAVADLRIAMPCAQPRLQFERVPIAAHAQTRFDPNLPFAPCDGVGALQLPLRH